MMKQKRLKLLALICSVNMMLTAVPMNVQSVFAATTQTVVLSSGYLNIRSSASTTAEIIGTLEDGATVSVISTSGEWSKIEVNGKTGYVMSSYLTDKKTAFTVTELSKTATVSGTTSLTVRKGPATSYAALGTLKKGAKVTVTGKASTGWYRIKYNGETAYASNKYLTLADDFTVSSLSKTGTVTGTTSLTVRTGPSTSYASVGTLSKGKKVTITGKASTGWYQISYDGNKRYVSNKYITLQQSVNTDVKGKTGIITGDVVNVRASASTSGAKLGTLTSGTKITLTGSTGNWYQFTYQSKTAYVSADYVTISGSGSDSFTVTDYSATGKVVNTTVLNIRSGPSADYGLLGTFAKGDTVTITGKASTGWYRINYSGKTGYISNSYVKLDSKQQVNQTGSVTGTNVLNVRSGAGTSYSIVDTLSRGKKVTVNYKTGDWYQITYDDKSGFVSTEYITLSTSSDDGTADSNAKYGVVTADALNFRTGPGTNYDSIAMLSYGTRITIIGTSSDKKWYQIQVGNTTGYVSAEYITVVDDDTTPNDGTSLQAAKLIQVATGEIGYVEASDGTTKYGQWYSSSHAKVAWCAMFISWCADQVDILNTVIPKHASCTAGISWFKNAGLWQNSGSYTPKVGDIVYFDWSGGTDPDHVGIVSMVADGKITTIEGNTTNSVAKRTYAITSSSIIGYGTPAYTE